MDNRTDAQKRAQVLEYFHLLNKALEVGRINENDNENNKFKCDVCGKSFAHLRNKHRHERTHREQEREEHACDICGLKVSRSDALTRHRKNIHNVQKRRLEDVDDNELLNEEPALNNQPEADNIVPENNVSEDNASEQDNNEVIEDIVAEDNVLEQDNNEDIEDNIVPEDNVPDQDNLHNDDDLPRPSNQALDGSVREYMFYPTGGDQHDILTFFANKKQETLDQLHREASSGNQFKWQITLQVKLVKHAIDGDEDRAEPYFNSYQKTVLREDQVSETEVNEAFHKIISSFDQYIRDGSGWQMDEIVFLKLQINEFRPLGGASYIPLPKFLKNKKCIMNVQNNDTKCFIWSVLASLYPNVPSRIDVRSYFKYQYRLNMTGLEFPVAMKDIYKFERNNNISINVFGFENNALFPLQITTLKTADHHVDLLLLTENDNRHYCLITNLNGLLRNTRNSKHTHHTCPYCLQNFGEQLLLTNHLPYCEPHGPQRVTLPDPQKNEDILKFKEISKQVPVSFIIVGDIECYTRPIDTCAPNPRRSSTVQYEKFEACGYGYQVLCHDKRYTKKAVVYRGENVMEHFLESLIEEEKRIKEILAKEEPMIITPDQEKEHRAAKSCYACGGGFTAENKKTRDHDHVTGLYRGPACNKCNLKLKPPPYVPVVFHNLRNFDSHILCEALGKFKNKNISCIPNNMEKYISFSLGDLRFIDSFQFMNSSLNKLVEDLLEEGVDNFDLLKEEYPEERHWKLLLRQGVFPYSYLQGPSTFAEDRLPPKEDFFNKLSQENVSEEDYQHALNVWEVFEMQNFGDYHDLYLLTDKIRLYYPVGNLFYNVKRDVVLLSCVFQRFRRVSQNFFQLDPAHFYTAPGLSWSSSLKLTKVNLKLLTDIDMVLFF